MSVYLISTAAVLVAIDVAVAVVAGELADVT